MYPTIAHIYGPLSINSYGLAILVGITVFTYFLMRDAQRPAIIAQETLINTIGYGVLLGVVGGRLLWAVSCWGTIAHWSEIGMVWEGGFSVLGSMIAVLVGMPLYLRSQGVPVFQFLDLVTVYAPLLHAISRLGCFLAGCCYGQATTVPWAITYTNDAIRAPLFVALHPTQLYSSLIFFGIFVLMVTIIRPSQTRVGQCVAWYLILASVERFGIDFLRGDRQLIAPFGFVFSFHQVIALGIIVTALGGLLYLRMTARACKSAGRWGGFA